ncbi:MAG: hypothetical protein ACRDPY_37215 [Streptosporangiaceae bacterium]
MEPLVEVSRDNHVHCLREVEFCARLSEKVDVRGHAVQETVGLDGVSAREREAERPGGIQRDAGKPLMKWIHAGT